MNILTTQIREFEERAYQIRNAKLKSKTTINASSQEWKQVAKELATLRLSKVDKLSLFLNLSNKTENLNTTQRLALMKSVLNEESNETDLSIDKLEEVADRNGISVDTKRDVKFWNEVITSTQRRIDIRPSAIKNILTGLNFYKNPRGGFIKLEGKFVSIASVSLMIEAVEEYIDKLPNEFFTEFNRDEVKDALVDKGSLFNKKNLMHLKVLREKFHRCNAHAIFFYGVDAFVEITRRGLTLKSYKRMRGVIWKNQIMDVEFSSFNFDDKQKSHFEEFVFDISGRNHNDANYMRKLTGYLLHRYNDPAFAKAVILVDKGVSEDETANGGRGKNVYCNSFGYMLNLNNTIDGRNYEFNSNPFKEVNESDDIVLINDADKNFPFDRLFNAITEGFTYRKLYQDTTKISFEQNPKIIINSNYALLNLDNYSEERRALVFYFSDYYQKVKLIDKFRKRFFLEWDKEEWNRFRLFMFRCAYEYLKYPHVLDEHKPTSLEKKTSKEFAQFMGDLKLEKGVFYNRALIRKKWLKVGEHVSKDDFSLWLIAYFKKKKFKMQMGSKKMVHRKYFYKNRGYDGFKILK